MKKVSVIDSHTGGELAIRLNTTTGFVDVFWGNESGERRPYGRIRAGEKKEFHTYAGHVWLVTDTLGSPLGFFEAAADVLEVNVDGKPVKILPPRERRNRRENSNESPDKNWSVQFTNQHSAHAAHGADVDLCHERTLHAGAEGGRFEMARGERRENFAEDRERLRRNHA